jgi:hypothetical protein
VHNPTRWKAETLRDLRIARLTTAEEAARVNQIWTGCAMHRTINTAAAKQRRVCRVHHDTHILFRDVAEHYFNIHP